MRRSGLFLRFSAVCDQTCHSLLSRSPSFHRRTQGAAVAMEFVVSCVDAKRKPRKLLGSLGIS